MYHTTLLLYPIVMARMREEVSRVHSSRTSRGKKIETLRRPLIFSMKGSSSYEKFFFEQLLCSNSSLIIIRSTAT